MSPSPWGWAVVGLIALVIVGLSASNVAYNLSATHCVITQVTKP